MSKDPSKGRKKRPTALKREIQNCKKRLANKTFKSRVRTAVRRFEEALQAPSREGIEERLSLVYSLMDKGVKKGVFKQGKSDRTKSRLSARLTATV